jgi:RNA polymerase-binding transcription factor DksA
LQELIDRITATARLADEQARQSTGGEAAGDLSNTPVHLGDIGSEEAAQELGATLLENERYLQEEIGAALERIEKGTFGVCENCARSIAHARLEALPYARYCAPCARQLHSGRAVNLNEGRPANWEEGIGLRSEESPSEQELSGSDSHAAGTPGGGTAVGGLAGTNIGAGAPEDAALEDAMGSGTFDMAIEGEQPRAERRTAEEEDETGGYSGHSGGAVGGTPANKRSRGGKR